MTKNNFLIMTITLALATSTTKSNEYPYLHLPEPYASVTRSSAPKPDHYGWFPSENKNNLKNFILTRQPKIIVELGSWLGESAIFMASLIQGKGRVYAVDTWRGSREHFIVEQWSKELPELYQKFLLNCIQSNVAETITPLRMTTLEAAKIFEKKPDLIYVDASHETEDVYNDIMAWYPKLNNNGVLCGDDWDWASVQKGVLRAVSELNVKLNHGTKFWYFTPTNN